jgi:hypothetical protein
LPLRPPILTQQRSLVTQAAITLALPALELLSGLASVSCGLAMASELTASEPVTAQGYQLTAR